NRQVLAIETDTSLPAARLIRVLDQLKESRGLPKSIRMDNGPEFISKKLDDWSKENKVTLVFIQPGKPTQNAFIERCNGSIQGELLNAYVFKTLNEVRIKAEEWMYDYNFQRPHKALNFKTPMDVLEEIRN
ncbi:integrase core domain-containing protein, partial [Solitalea koreensis]